MSADTNVILIEDLHKRYDDVTALRGLSLSVDAGQVYGLLGPNGAGKSTLIHLLMGFLRPDSGTIRVLGQSPQAIAGRVGYLPERLRYHTHCTGREYLHYMGRFGNEHGAALRQRVAELLTLIDLDDAADRRMKTYSKGMLQRIGIAQALISDPDVLLIDEPSSGLDPAGQYEMQQLLLNLREREHTILLCSHQLDEITSVCDRVGILMRGQLATEVNPATLPGTAGILITLRDTPDDEIDYGLRGIDTTITRSGSQITLPAADDRLQQRVLQLLLDRGLVVQNLQSTAGSLRDVYLQVVHGGIVAPEPAPEPPLLDVLLASKDGE